MGASARSGGQHSASEADDRSGTSYVITVKGGVDASWSGWFDGMVISPDPNGDTILRGTVADQAALHGLIAKVRDLGLVLVAVEPRLPEPVVGTRSPVSAIAASMAAGALAALALILGPVAGGSEATITGSVLLASGLGWGLMAVSTTRFSRQPQSWMSVPASVLGLIGLGLVVVQPGPSAMDALAWMWPPVIASLGVWMLVQVRRHLIGRGRWLVVPLTGALLLMAGGGALAASNLGSGPTTAPAAGQRIDVGEHSLYIECRGSGAPVVILQVGMGGSAADWGRVAPAIAETTTVCAYDRAGHGLSDEAGGPQDGNAIAADLHTLLERAAIAGPYVLVGHSSGGPYMRVFADRYADEVAGMVLLDAQPADAFTALPDFPSFYGPYRVVSALAPPLARIGILGPVLGSPVDPTGIRTARAMRDEVAVLPAALAQAGALTSIGDRPLIVVSAGADQQAGWLAAQDGLVALSGNHAHRVLMQATHESLLGGDDAVASSQAILDVVAAVRTGSPVR